MPVKGLVGSQQFAGGGRWSWNNRSVSSRMNDDHPQLSCNNNRYKALTLFHANGIVPGQYNDLLTCHLAFTATEYREGT